MNYTIYLDDKAVKYLTNQLDKDNVSYAITKEKLLEGEINCISFEDKPYVLNSVFIAGVAYTKGVAQRQEADLVIKKALSEHPKRKVTIKENNSISGDGFYSVETAEGLFTKIFSFKLREDDPQSIWNKDKNLAEATEYAKKLETYQNEQKTIYETPDDDIV